MKNTSHSNPKFVFFGTPDIAVTALAEMASFGFIPSLIVCNPDAPVGRKQIITPPPTKVWAVAHNLPVLQPAFLPKIPPPNDGHLMTVIGGDDWDFFVVFAYGKIMPEWLINLPKYGTINAHPSLLPKLRGASPIRSTLLTNLSAGGVTIIQMDKELDHGPILKQQKVALVEPISGENLDNNLAHISGNLLVQVMQELPLGSIIPRPQNHNQATFCTKISKDMSLLKIDPTNLPVGKEAKEVYQKICAFAGWPGTFFFYHDKRVKIKSARLTKTGQLEILRIIPEGKNETDFQQYFQIKKQ